MEKIKIAGWPAILYTNIVWMNRWMLNKEYFKIKSTDSCTVIKNIFLFIGLMYVAYLIVFQWFFNQLFQLINAFSSPEFTNAVFDTTIFFSIIIGILLFFKYIGRIVAYIYNKFKKETVDTSYFADSADENIYIPKKSKVENIKDTTAKLYDSFKNDYCIPVEIETKKTQGEEDEKSTK